MSFILNIFIIWNKLKYYNIYTRDSQPFLNGDTLVKTSAIPWHPTHGETPTLTFNSIRKENT
jgi:hypothetical protein